MRQASLVIVALAVISAGCGSRQAPPAPPPPQVTVQKPVLRELTDYQEFSGRMDAVETAEVRVRIKGFLQKIHFKEGSEVKHGDLLYEIDPRTFEAEVARNEAEVKRQQAQLKLAETEVARVESLRGTVGAVTEEQYSQRVAAREAARASLQQAQAALEAAKLELSFTKITAPISGQISRTLVTEGNLVGYNEPTLLTTIVRLDPIYVFFEVSERIFLEYQRKIREQGVARAVQGVIPIFVGLATENDFPHAGTLNFRDNRIDQSTGTMTLRGEIPNADRVLVPGLFARVRVPVSQPRQRLMVPELIIQTDQRGQFVLVVDGENNVVYRPVTTGMAADGMVSIESGLKPDDWVVVNGIQKARPGSKVQPVRQEAQNTPPAAATGSTPQNQAPGGSGASPPTSGPVPPPGGSNQSNTQ